MTGSCAIKWVPEGEMDTYENEIPAAAEECFDFHLEKWNGCACRPFKSSLNIMCNQDSLGRSSDGVEGDEQQSDWSEEEEASSGTTGMYILILFVFSFQALENFPRCLRLV
jgi:hypothetical protein